MEKFGKRTLSRRSVLSAVTLLAVGVAAGMSPGPAVAQDAAQKPLRIVVPYPAGGASDTVARVIGQELQARLKTTVVVENRPGASGLIALDAVQKSPPDGSTLLLVSGAQTLALAMQAEGFDVTRHLTPLGMLYTQKLILVTSPESRVGGVKSVAELVAFGKGQASAPLTFASSSPGTMGHLMMERFKRDAGIQMTHVPYKGSSAAALDVAGGRVDLFLADATSSMPLVRTGKLRPISIAGAGRVGDLPEVRTFAEQGFANMVPSIWAGLAGSPGLPADVTQRLAVAIKAALESPAVQEKLRSSGNEPWYLPPAEMQKYVNENTSSWSDFIKKTGISWN
jgi:tripartite-type tricarboxylate transporter receptor subunit TctC